MFRKFWLVILLIVSVRLGAALSQVPENPEKQPARPQEQQKKLEQKKQEENLRQEIQQEAQSKALEKSDRLTAMDFFNLQYARDPQLSPDGKRIVYVRHFADVTADKNASNLWIINVNGGEHRPLTSGVHNDTSPRWSPDGTQISFAAMVPSEAPSWAKLPKSPKEAKWHEAPKAYENLIYRFNAAGYQESGYTQIFVVSADGGTPRQITTGNFQHGGLPFRGSEAVWTPDGKYLLVSANRRPDYEYDPLNTEIYEFSVADGAVRALTNRRGPDGSPQVSPDGKHITYVGFDDKYQGYQVTKLYLMNRDGGNPHSISERLDRDVRNPRWAPDGSGVFFLYDERGDTKLGFYSTGGQFKKIADHVGGSGSSYASGSFSVARGGGFAIEHTTPEIPGDIAVGNVTEPKVKALTAVNRDLLAQRKLCQVEEFNYESSEDHRKIQG